MKTVFFDIDTQIDFLFPAGALYAPGAEKIIGTVAKLNHHAARHRIPLVSTMDAHSENDPEFRDWPHHCVVDTLGQQKPASTLLEKRQIVPNSPCALNLTLIDQILLEKQTFSAFSNHNFTLLLDYFAAERYVVYGVVTEVCVKFAAFGLLETEKSRRSSPTQFAHSTKRTARRRFAEFVTLGGHLTQAGMIYA